MANDFRKQPPGVPVDSSSQALSDALRSSFVIVKLVMIVLVVVFFGSGLFTVREGERAIKLRFGKPVGEGESALLLPGLHWSWPYPIEEYRKIPITAIQNIQSTIGMYQVTPEQELAGTVPPPSGPTLNMAADGYVLTADGNIVHTRAIVQYRISDPISYIFEFNNASNAVQNAIDNSLLWAASRFNVDQMLRRDVIGFTDAVRHRIETLVTEQKLGVFIEQCSVHTVPPRQLTQAFDNVFKAENNRNKLLQEARSYENEVLSKASAEAQSRLNSAEASRVLLVAEVQSLGQQFQELLPRYEENPRLFVEQRLADRLGRVLTNVQDKIFLGEGTEPKELRLLLNREPVRPAAQQQPGVAP